MQPEDTKVIVVGLGKSGFELLKFLDKNNIKTEAYDSKSNYDKCLIEGFSNNININLGKNPSGEEECSSVIVSPGVPVNLDFLNKFKARGIEIIGEVEFAYRHAEGTFVSITGTNGKTTTTTLTGEIFKSAGLDTRVVGNIGNPIISEVMTSNKDTFFVSELSSFQLETINSFKSKSAAVINITPDHLDRHGNIDNYADIKFNVFNNQETKDYAILNIEDPKIKELSKKITSNIIFFSTNQKLGNGIYIEDGIIKFNDGTQTIDIIKRDEVYLKGKHNLENVMTAIGLALSCNINIDVIAKVLREFRGVEHRLEFVETIDGVEYINDSKGTNPDSSIKALETYDKNVILIAGGYDKKSDFDGFIKLFEGRVKMAIFMGVTKEQLAKTCDKNNFKNYIYKETMKEAVEFAKSIALKGDTVLLSPACASWGMYNNYEERGDDFKNIVRGNN